MHHVGILYALFNGVIYVVWVTLEITMACTKGDTRTGLHMAEVFFASTINIVSAVVFWVSGYCVASTIRNLADSFVFCFLFFSHMRSLPVVVHALLFCANFHQAHTGCQQML